MDNVLTVLKVMNYFVWLCENFDLFLRFKYKYITIKFLKIQYIFCLQFFSNIFNKYKKNHEVE